MAPAITSAPVPNRSPIGLIAIGVVAAAVLSGCAFDDKIKSHEKGVLFPSGRIGYEIHPGVSNRKPGSVMDRIRGGSTEPEAAGAEPKEVVDYTLSVAADVGYGEAKDKQKVARDREVWLSGTDFEGPAKLDLDYSLVHSRLFVRGGFSVWDILRFEGLIGGGVDHLNMKVKSGERDKSDGDPSGGLLFGAGVTVRPDPAIDLFGEATTTVGDATFDDIRVGGTLNLTHNIGLTGGYRWWWYEDGRLGNSDIDLELEGPTFGVELMF